MIFTFIFIAILSAVTVVNLIGNAKKDKKLIYISKPFLMPLVVLIYTIGNPSINWLVVIGLFCGLAGDILLLDKNNEKAFMLGLVAFLVGHILYVITFWSLNAAPWIYILLFPYAVIGIFIFKFLKPDLGYKKIPVIVYTAVILLMSFATITRFYSSSPTSASLVFIGGVSFIISDVILAINKFKGEIKYGTVYNMLTYILGQFLIGFGLLF
ncbi:MAG: lysoplasmalogenase [Candidatus Hodarchaeota archaeon]